MDKTGSLPTCKVMRDHLKPCSAVHPAETAQVAERPQHRDGRAMIARSHLVAECRRIQKQRQDGPDEAGGF